MLRMKQSARSGRASRILILVLAAAMAIALVPRARPDPVSERDGADARHLLRDHPLARVELGKDVFLHSAIVTGCWFPRPRS